MLSNKNHGFVVKNILMATNRVGFGDCSLNPQAVNIPSDIWSEWNKYKLHKLGIIQETRGSLEHFSLRHYPRGFDHMQFLFTLF